MLPTLKKRAEFLRLRGGARFETSAFVIEAKTRPASSDESAPIGLAPATTVPTYRFGFTVTKRLGKAVLRNRIRRRLREAVRLKAPACARRGVDYVVIARSAAATRDFADLLHDFEVAFAKVSARLDRPGMASRPPQHREKRGR